MSWVRLDDGAPGHRKIVGLSDAAFRLWIVGLSAMKQLDKRFGSRLAAVMARRKVSHRALADYCGVSPRSISNWVAGHKPPLPILRLIGTWWDCATVDYLTGASDVMPEPVRTEEG